MKQLAPNDFMKFIQNDKEPFHVYSAPITSSHRITIDDDFREVAQFAELVDVLDNAQEGDCVQIRLSTPGGALHSIIPLMNAMKNTEAYVHVHVESDTASAGTVLMMLANSVYVNEYSTIMLHTASYGFYGHSGNMESHVTHATPAIEKFLRDTYQMWLTDAEILRMMDGKELYFNADECHKRFDKREELRVAQEEADLAAVEAAISKAKEPKPPKKPKQTKKDKPEKFLEGAYDKKAPSTPEEAEYAAIMSEFIVK